MDLDHALKGNKQGNVVQYVSLYIHILYTLAGHFIRYTCSDVQRQISYLGSDSMHYGMVKTICWSSNWDIKWLNLA